MLNSIKVKKTGEQRMKHEKSKNDAMRHELDHIDAKILNLLRENARMPLKEIAEHVFLSSPAVSARI